MFEFFKIIRKAVTYLALFFYLPLFIFAETQSLSAIYGSQGAEAINPVQVWFLTKNNAKILWFKTIGVFPVTSMLPWVGENFVVRGSSSHAEHESGGCSIALEMQDNANYEIALGFAKCTRIDELRINEDFAQLTPPQLDYSYQLIEATRQMNYGLSAHVNSAYAILAMADEVGPVSVSEYLEKRCAEALLGKEAQRDFCLIALEVEETLNKVGVGNENERKAVAIKAGIQSWIWMASDEGLSKEFWREWIYARPSTAANATIMQWAASYAPYRAGKPSMLLLRRTWSCGELDQVNAILKKSHLNQIGTLAWETACRGH